MRKNYSKALVAMWILPLISGILYAQQAPLQVACSPEKLVVSPREAVRLRAWVASAVGPVLQYTWAANAGRVDGEGPEARWDFAGVSAGAYRATVRITDPVGGFTDCSVQVIVRPLIRGELPRESGGSFLSQGEAEEDGYGLYSYVLLGSPPTPAARERYLRALEEYLKFPNARSLEVYIPRRDLNIVYLPIKVISESGVSAEWVLEHYDYARSRSLLRAVPGHRRDGPYIVSVLKPLSRTTTLSGQYLDQDLSAVPPHLVTAWVREFLNQAAQERFWEARTVQRFALRLRTTIAIAAVGLPEVKDGLDRWISWVR